MAKSISKETLPLLGSFSSSFFGQAYKIWYTLKVFVKHDAWNDWGEGKAIEFPIKIMSSKLKMVRGAPRPDIMRPVYAPINNQRQP